MLEKLRLSEKQEKNTKITYHQIHLQERVQRIRRDF